MDSATPLSTAKKGKLMLRAMLHFDWDSIPQFKIRALAPFMVNPNFSPDKIQTHNRTAAAMCTWALVVASSRARYLEWLGEKAAEVVRTVSRGAANSTSGLGLAEEEGDEEEEGNYDDDSDMDTECYSDLGDGDDEGTDEYDEVEFEKEAEVDSRAKMALPSSKQKARASELHQASADGVARRVHSKKRGSKSPNSLPAHHHSKRRPLLRKGQWIFVCLCYSLRLHWTR